MVADAEGAAVMSPAEAREALHSTTRDLAATLAQLELATAELESAAGVLDALRDELRAGQRDVEAAHAELRRQGEAAHHTAAIMRATIATVDDAVVVVDHDGRIEQWNAAAVDVFGRLPETVVGRKVVARDLGLGDDVLAPGDHARPIVRDVSIAAPGRDERRWRVTAIGLFDAAGNRDGVVLVIVPTGR